MAAQRYKFQVTTPTHATHQPYQHIPTHVPQRQKSETESRNSLPRRSDIIFILPTSPCTIDHHDLKHRLSYIQRTNRKESFPKPYNSFHMKNVLYQKLHQRNLPFVLRPRSPKNGAGAMILIDEQSIRSYIVYFAMARNLIENCLRPDGVHRERLRARASGRDAIRRVGG